MFSYGEDNVIDFTSLKGLYGLFAANASGKSTLLDALAFCCFDKCSRTSKASHVLNNKKNSFSAEFNFELNGKDYFISRIGTRDKNGHVRVIVEFYSINEIGDKELLNGDERSDTNNNIRSYLGNYDDFVLTALSLQNNNTGFIDKSQKEKKELLSQFLDINVFEDLYALASEEIKSVSVLLKDYQKHDFSGNLVNAEKTITKLTTEYNKLVKSKDKLTKKRDTLNADILVLTAKLKPIDTSILSLDELNQNKDSYKDQLDIELKNKLDTETQITVVSTKIAKILKDITQFDTKELETDYTTLLLKEQESLKNTNQIQKLKVEIGHKLDKLKKLEEHEYDPNCEFCINNVFVKDAIETKKQLKTDKDELEILEQKCLDLKKEIEAVIYTRADKDSVTAWRIELSKNQIIESQLQTKLHKVEALIKDYEAEIVKIDADIKKYLLQKDAVKFNLKINSDIDLLNDELGKLKIEIAAEENSIIRIHGDIKVSEKIKKDSEEAIEQLKTLEREARGYEFYLEAIKRDGIPTELITTALPQIELEINNILTQIVDFNIILQTDGKNINAFIVYDDDNYWPLELSSGMEKFISSLAIRASLISVSNLPRPNFIAIDEGFGNLDNENLNSMYMLFDYLKTQFDFVIIISHLDVMRDVVDHLINIAKDNGHSKMVYL
jgi:DNA repair exonuclease SbcCD ATPase subunit